MARFYSEDPKYTEISTNEKAIRDRIVEVISRYTLEMEGYSFYGSNPGVAEDHYEDVADEIMIELGIK